MHINTTNNLNELQRMITVVVRKGKAFIRQRQQEKKRSMEMLQQEIKTLEGKYYSLQHHCAGRGGSPH